MGEQSEGGRRHSETCTAIPGGNGEGGPKPTETCPKGEAQRLGWVVSRTGRALILRDSLREFPGQSSWKSKAPTNAVLSPSFQFTGVANWWCSVELEGIESPGGGGRENSFPQVQSRWLAGNKVNLRPTVSCSVIER